MLITLCYSVLTWMQSRQRSEIVKWVEELLLKEGECSLVFIRDLGDNSIATIGRSESAFNYATTFTEDQLANGVASSCPNSALNTPSRRPSSSATTTPIHQNSVKRSTSFDSTTGSLRQISTLPYNNGGVRLRRLLWQEDNTRAIVLMPRQIVELYEWTGFKGVDFREDVDALEGERSFLILLEAEPGLVKRHQYKKFSQWGEIVCWRCGGSELGLILRSKLTSLIELMHIFRIGGQIILDGGWRIFRLTTIICEGTIGTEISPLLININEKNKSLTPADLRRLSAGVYECSLNGLSTPRSSLSKSTSRHDITTITEEDFNFKSGELNTSATSTPLPNWYDNRSPRKRSVAALPSFQQKSQNTTPRRRSFCPGSLLGLGGGGGSRSSVFLCTQSISVDEEDEVELIAIPPSTLNLRHESKSQENLLSTPTLLTPMMHQNPATTPSSKEGSKSTGASPRKRSPHKKRHSKPPNILLLSDDPQKAQVIGKILKDMLSNDRYAIYDIRWDQLEVGGWSEQTALLVVTGSIKPGQQCGRLLQFLGDGGRLLAWCCDTPPFGPTTGGKSTNSILEYGPSKRVCKPLNLSGNLWAEGFQKFIETTDSEGYSRPLTLSSWANIKGARDAAIIQADGGALGGKAAFSQVQFEANGGEEEALSLLSLLLSQCLGIDCTQIKSPEYTSGFLLGDHKKAMEFLASTPGTVQQPELTLEFVSRDEKPPLPSHLKLPIISFTCPPDFSTLDYFENLETKELGRLVIYSHTLTSTSHVLQGHSLRHGLTVVATRQTSARGRGKNIWLSPVGCAVFSLQLHLNLSSQIGRRLSLIQHIAALAVILSVERHKEIDLRVKWPNDIYAGDQKVGGVLVESTLQGSTAVVNLGIGVNVSNAYPTQCLNVLLHGEGWKPDALPKERKAKGYLCSEQVIAKILTQLEILLDKIETKPGLEEIVELYQDNWIHGSGDDEEESVSVEVTEGAFSECVIVGIDPYGFLRVRDVTSGHVLSVRPDGNSFDIANRLIAIKE